MCNKCEKVCNKCIIYENYLIGDIPPNVINEFNNRMGGLIDDKNIDNFRTNPLLISLSKKNNNNFKVKKIFNNQLICFNENLTVNNYLQILVYLLDQWSNCECFVNSKNPINVLMNFKFMLKYFEELNVIPSEVCYKLRKILRFKLHIKDQIQKVRETIIELM